MCLCLGSIELAFIVQRGLREKLWLPRPPQTPWTMGASLLSRSRGHSSPIWPLPSLVRPLEQDPRSEAKPPPSLNLSHGAHREGKLQDLGRSRKGLTMRALLKKAARTEEGHPMSTTRWPGFMRPEWASGSVELKMKAPIRPSPLVNS